MPADLTRLIQKQAELQQQLAAAQAAIAAQKAEAVQQVKDFMTELGITVDDLQPKTAAAVRPGGSKRAVKYSDGAGNTWTGVGQRPRWVAKALLNGATLEQFLVKK